MRYLSNVNRKKIFQDKWLIIALVIFTISVLFILRSEKTNYLSSGRVEISDGTEYRYLLENEIIDENRIREALEKYKDRIFPQDFKYIDIKDYFLMRNITQIYGMELKDTDEPFFHKREEIMKAGNEYSSMQNIDSIAMGYAEGWKIVTENFSTQLYALWAVLMFIFLPVYNEDCRFKFDELIRSTELGKDKLNKIRIRNVYEIIIELYFWAAAIYLFLIFMIYGIDGYNLPVQNSPQYFLSSMNMNYLAAFLYQLFCGFIITCFIGNVFLWISKFIEDVKMGYAVIIGLVVLDYGFRYFMSSAGFHSISTISPIVAMNMENILFGENIMNISPIIFRFLIYIFLVFISTVLLSKIKRARSEK